MLEDIQDEIDEVMGDKERPDYDDIVGMVKLRAALIESLRLYPEPPVLIRRALKDDVLPQGGSKLKKGVKIMKGADIFISTWNIHRSEALWGPTAEKFDPSRWCRARQNPDVKVRQGELGLLASMLDAVGSILPLQLNPPSLRFSLVTSLLLIH